MAENVLWIASYPKSGNTWLHSIIQSACIRLGDLPGSIDVYNYKIGDDLPKSNQVNSAISNDECVLLKTHAAYVSSGLIHPKLNLATKAFINITRNPLDVVLSYINYSRLEYRIKENDIGYKDSLFKDLLNFTTIPSVEEWMQIKLDSIPRENLDHALEVFSLNNLSLPVFYEMSGSWYDHTKSWLSGINDVPGVILRYEDCIANSYEFTKIIPLFKFTSENLSDAILYFDDFVKNSKQSDNKIFFNKMSSNYFVNYFSERAIKRFLNKHGDELCSVGYKDMLNLYKI